MTERHEALAQTVELLALRNEETSKNIDRLIARDEEFRRDFVDVKQSIRDLVYVLHQYSSRISKLEAA